MPQVSRPPPQDFPPYPLPFDKPACRCRSRIRQKIRRPCRWSPARPRRIFCRTCCSPTSPLAVRRSCPRETQRTPRLKTKLTARRCSSPPTDAARALGRRRAVRAAGLPARLRGIFRRTRSSPVSLLAVRRSCPREIQPNAAPENKTDRAAMQLHACRCRSRIRQKTRPPMPLVCPPAPTGFSAVPAALRQAR